MIKEITYAKAGKTPWNWQDLEIYDGDRRLTRVAEVDTVNGYAKLLVTGESGDMLRDDVGSYAYHVIRSKNLRIVEQL